MIISKHHPNHYLIIPNLNRSCFSSFFRIIYLFCYYWHRIKAQLSWRDKNEIESMPSATFLFFVQCNWHWKTVYLSLYIYILIILTLKYVCWLFNTIEQYDNCLFLILRSVNIKQRSFWKKILIVLTSFDQAWSMLT
jgi:hypothetical protein